MSDIATVETQAQPSRLVGYARVSTDDQNLTLQLDALTRHGISRSDIFTDKQSGAKAERPGLTKCMDGLQAGDILVVWRLDRLGRSMRHLITLVEDLRERGIGFRSLNEGGGPKFSCSVHELLYGLGSRTTHRALFTIRHDIVFVFSIRHVAQRDVSPDDL